MKTRTQIMAPDRLTAPALSPHDAAWRAAVQPFDQAVCRVEQSWGSLARLQRHATPETVARFGRAVHAFEEKLEDAASGKVEADELARYAGAVVRGIAKLEDEAGDPKLPPMLAYNEPGNESSIHLVIVPNETDASIVAKELPKATIFSLPEIARILANYQESVLETILAAKKLFPEAQVVATRERSTLAQELQDEIPF